MRAPKKRYGLVPGSYKEQVWDKEGFAYRAVRFGPEFVEQEEAELPSPGKGVLWLDVSGTPSVEWLSALAEKFGIHSLTIEDILNFSHRPKFEEFDSYLFFIAKAVRHCGEDGEFTSDQFSILLGKGFVISFQEKKDADFFAPVRSRIEKAKGRVRTKGADYLAYSLLDFAVDQHFIVLEAIEEIAESIDEKVLSGDYQIEIERGHRQKRELLRLRKKVVPMREFLGALLRQPPNMIDKKNSVFFRDLYDHVVQIAEGVELQRENISSMIENAHAMSGRDMNSVMKLLAVVSAIFLPLNLVVGFYGMNTQRLPFANHPNSHFFVLGMLVFIAVGLFVIFRQRRWW